MYLSFNQSANLMFLFIIPVIIFFHFFGLKNLKGRSLKFANFEAIYRIKGIDIYSKNITPLIFDILFVILLVFAISGAVLHMEADASLFSYIIAIDSSESMSAKDMLPNRLSVAKKTAMGFVDSSPYQTSIGIVSFAGDSIVEQGLSIEKSKVRLAIDNIEINSVSGTDLYEAILVSTYLLKGEDAKSIILLSDGQINIGSFDEVISYAVNNDITVHSISIGTVEGGEVDYGISKVDIDSLKSIAYNTGGSFFSANNEGEINSAFSEILQITRRPISVNLSFYLIALALALFLFREFLMSINKISW